MSDQNAVGAGKRRSTNVSVAPLSDRAPWQRGLLVLNISILVFSAYVVWTRLAGANERDDAFREVPLQTTTSAGVGGAVGSSARPPEPTEDETQPAVGDSARPPRSVGEERTEATESEPRVADLVETQPRVGPAAGSDREPGVRPGAGPSPGSGTSLASGTGERPSRDDVGPEPSESEPVHADPPPVRPLDPAARRRVAATQRRIDELGVRIEVLCNKTGAYVSSAREFGTHRGIEALYVALVTQGQGSGLDVGDADGDGRLEILDDWGRPLVFISHDDYDAEQAWASGGTAPQAVTGARSRSRGVHHARGRFQLWSAGPNGRNEQGAGDDVTSWVLRD